MTTVLQGFLHWVGCHQHSVRPLRVPWFCTIFAAAWLSWRGIAKTGSFEYSMYDFLTFVRPKRNSFVEVPVFLAR